MTTAIEDLNNFRQFATSIVSNGQTELTLADLVKHWQQAKKRDSANESICQSLAEFEAGQGEPVREFLDKIKSKYDLTLDSKA
ncbi:hypothetical protein N9Y42_02295 [Mariniblastus sp.]|nr:hypothetical protein [Mariniblastus sp.]